MFVLFWAVNGRIAHQLFQSQHALIVFIDGRSTLHVKVDAIVKRSDIFYICLLYTSDAADDTPCVDLGGRRIIKKKK